MSEARTEIMIERRGLMLTVVVTAEVTSYEADPHVGLSQGVEIEEMEAWIVRAPHITPRLTPMHTTRIRLEDEEVERAERGLKDDYRSTLSVAYTSRYFD